jgi:hypothetical protein
MEENLLDVLWSAHFVDRRVKQTLQSLFGVPDKSLIRIIRKREPKLTPKDIAESLRRLDLRFESATPVPTTPISVAVALRVARTPEGKHVKRARKGRGNKEHIGVKLVSLVEDGYLKTPLRLFREVKGKVLEATLHPDGTVEWHGKRFSSCSTAAIRARASVAGHPISVNGWNFWHYVDSSNRTLTLADARKRYLSEDSSV